MIPVFKPYLNKKEIKAVGDALNVGWLGQGKLVASFEEKIADLIGINKSNVVCVNTGTSAIKIALHIAGVGHGDEVITPSFNNIGVIQSITDLGAIPIFCDIKYEDMTINPENISKLISKKTKAINCLDYGSNLCDLTKIKKIAEKNKIKLVYDAAHSFGSKRGKFYIGNKEDLCTFSFDPVKNITSVDGGAIIFRKIKDAKKARHLRLLGQMQNQNVLNKNGRSWIYDVKEQGYRFHLSNINAAIGLVQLKKIKQITMKRRMVFKLLDRFIESSNNLIKPLPISSKIVPFIYVIRLKKNRNQIMRYLKSKNIDTGIHWQPCHKFSKFKKLKKKDNLKNTNKIGNEILTLPMYPELKIDQIKKINKHLNNALKKFN